MVLISVSVVSAMSASKATPVAICIMPVATELLDWMPESSAKPQVLLTLLMWQK
jgi:hypothetical protein